MAGLGSPSAGVAIGAKPTSITCPDMAVERCAPARASGFTARSLVEADLGAGRLWR